MKKLTFFLLLLLFCLPVQAQFVNIRYSDQFAGATQGEKITAAQDSCLAGLPCIVVLTPILAAYPLGTLPTRPTAVMWLDYRTSGTFSASSWAGMLDASSFPTLAAAFAAGDALGGRVVFIPNGTYTLTADPFSGLTNAITLVLGETVTINTSVTLIPPSGSRIIGTSYNSRFHMTANPGERIIRINSNQVEVSGLRFTTADTDGDAAAAGRGAVHVGTSGSRCWVHHNYFDNVGQTGITVEGTNCDVADNVIVNPREHGIYVSNGTENDVHDNLIFDAGQSSVLTASQGIKCAACTRTNIHHNYVENPFQTGISLEESSPGTDISDTVVDGNEVVLPGATSSGHGIRISAAATGRASIRNNTVILSNTAANVAGIYIFANAGGHQVSGNKVVVSNTNTNVAAIRNNATGSVFFEGNLLIADAAVPYGFIADAGSGSVVQGNGVLSGTGTFTMGIRTTSTSAAVVWNTVQATTLYQLASDTLFRAYQENCVSSASPAVCGNAPSGSVTIAAAATTKTVNSTAVTANSQILIMEDSSLGTRLSVTCNTTIVRTYVVTARTAGTSFVVTASAAPTTNPACLSYEIIN